MVPKPSPSIYQAPKCFVTHGTLGHVDSAQGSSGRKPWARLSSMGFIQKVDLILSRNSATILHEKLASLSSPPSYLRVKLTLGQIFERNFFTHYIKNGNVSMISQGKKAIDDMFTIEKGILFMYLGKDSYEKAGLMGKPYGAKGDRKLRPRWVVTLDLTTSAMVHGKKGFDRLMYACDNVFSQPLTWLLSHNSGDGPTPAPLLKHCPTAVGCSTKVEYVETPNITFHVGSSIVAGEDRSTLEDFATELYEWLSLARLGSPRIRKDDSLDAYLSRYEAPDFGDEQMEVCVFSWQGLISAEWLYQFAMGIVTTLPQGSWFSLAATELSGSLSGASKEVVILRSAQPWGGYLMWEIQSPE